MTDIEELVRTLYRWNEPRSVEAARALEAQAKKLETLRWNLKMAHEATAAAHEQGRRAGLEEALDKAAEWLFDEGQEVASYALRAPSFRALIAQPPKQAPETHAGSISRIPRDGTDRHNVYPQQVPAQKCTCTISFFCPSHSPGAR